MKANKHSIKGSFAGISGDLVRNILIIMVNVLINIVCKIYKNSLYKKHNISSSFLEYLINFDDLSVVIILAVINLVVIIVYILIISAIIKTISLFYHIPRNVVIDYENNKIIDTSYSFFIIKNIDENKYNEIINVNIEQGLFQRMFNTGTLYIEYVANTAVDSQLRHIEIPCIANPFMQKNKLI
ncbi:MAG: PH domain-containing protein [Clostridiales bacterium]|uniref:PH domain-containing protein n=1 Tax=Clostridium sp. N3C TaxID=1776758 RepID=UPI00092DEF59|nr:PH domain-containing protein [Clostridium sp. N3C]NLZ48170.1 PH domain-containing protein [Clostridiales bacterium]SCN22283.1 Bacterial membrane flanked domain protein [Clostridium sp. N3C]